MIVHSLLSALPTASNRRIAVRVTPAAERMARAGHPWLFENSITEQSHSGSAGDLAVVFDRKRRFLAIGLYDPDSPISVRILHHGTPKSIDAAWFQQRLTTAINHRTALADTHTTGYRLVHGENDGFPGLVVDRYDATLVMKLYSAAWLPHLDAIVTGLSQICSPAHIILRLNRSTEQLAKEGKLFGLSNGLLLITTDRDKAACVDASIDAPIDVDAPRTVQFLENGLRFEADPVRGQKTGFFLDQRENRARVEKLAQGKSVLNVFAYSGGFSLYAARGGATQVDSLDLSRSALAAAKRNFELNRACTAVAAARHELLQGDAFELMAALHKQGRVYDMVLIDPPSFAKKKSETERAISSYYRLTQLGLKLLASQGLFMQASCSSRVDADTFFRGIHQAADDLRRPLRELERSGHPLDHPMRFKEGAYLKCLFATPKYPAKSS